MFDQENMTEEEKRDELWHYFESYPKLMEEHRHNYSHYDWDLEQDYHPK